jgi:hypothetical protein
MQSVLIILAGESGTAPIDPGIVGYHGAHRMRDCSLAPALFELYLSQERPIAQLATKSLNHGIEKTA